MYKILGKHHARIITYLLVIVGLFFVHANYNFADSEFTNILLLNSYHDGYEWSNDIKLGIKDVLAVDVDYNMRIEHMDTKHISTDEYLEELYQLYKNKYDKNEFDVIISADDNALKFLLMYREDLFGDTPIFFCGINILDIHDFEDVSEIYGVVEKHSITSTVEMAIGLNPKINNVYLVVDDTITGKATKRDAREKMEKYKDIINFEIIENKSYEEILDFTSTLDPVESIVIQSFYVVDSDGSTYPLEYTAKKLIEISNAPVFSLYSFGFSEGSVGGKFVEGYTQGERVAIMVKDYILEGSYNGKQFIVDDSLNRIYFDYSVIKELGYNINDVPKESIIINKPINFYERNKRVINISLAIFALLLIYVYILRRQVNIQSSKVVTTQNQLMSSEKMAALGRLVAGISHEVNTPVGIGVTLSSYMKKETENITDYVASNELSKERLDEYLEDMHSSSKVMVTTMNRASSLIQSFKQVAVDQSIDEKRTVELKEYLEEVVASLKSVTKKKDIQIKIESYETIDAYIYTGAIYQIFSNLIMNSVKHGFHNRDSGVIDIKLAKKNASFPIGKNDEVYIVYRDNGEGIEENNISKIYDPFYTTKKSKGGSGLGLNIVYNLVIDRLNGTIECVSELGEYTQFEIKFPIEYKVVTEEKDYNEEI